MSIVAKLLLAIVFTCGSVYAEETNMNEQDAQKTWDEYHERLKQRRLAEASIINAELAKAAI